VKKEREFEIPFHGLSHGLHQFVYKIEDEFFESFEYFENEKGQLRVELNILKEPALLDMHFVISGHIDMICDRCLGKLRQPVAGEYRLVVKFGKDYLEESDEIVVLPVAQTSLDVKQYIFEYINLLLPVKRVHENPEDCDQEMILRLEKYSERKSDPRWDALKNIKIE